MSCLCLVRLLSSVHCSAIQVEIEEDDRLFITAETRRGNLIHRVRHYSFKIDRMIQ